MVRSERGGTRDEKLRMWNEGKGVRVGGGGLDCGRVYRVRLVGLGHLGGRKMKDVEKGNER